jgi:hypothetical protein
MPLRRLMVLTTLLALGGCIHGISSSATGPLFRRSPEPPQPATAQRYDDMQIYARLEFEARFAEGEGASLALGGEQASALVRALQSQFSTKKTSYALTVAPGFSGESFGEYPIASFAYDSGAKTLNVSLRERGSGMITPWVRLSKSEFIDFQLRGRGSDQTAVQLKAVVDDVVLALGAIGAGPTSGATMVGSVLASTATTAVVGRIEKRLNDALSSPTIVQDLGSTLGPNVSHPADGNQFQRTDRIIMVDAEGRPFVILSISLTMLSTLAADDISNITPSATRAVRDTRNSMLDRASVPRLESTRPVSLRSSLESVVEIDRVKTQAANPGDAEGLARACSEAHGYLVSQARLSRVDATRALYELVRERGFSKDPNSFRSSCFNQYTGQWDELIQMYPVVASAPRHDLLNETAMSELLKLMVGTGNAGVVTPRFAEKISVSARPGALADGEFDGENRLDRDTLLLDLLRNRAVAGSSGCFSRPGAASNAAILQERTLVFLPRGTNTRPIRLLLRADTAGRSIDRVSARFATSQEIEELCSDSPATRTRLLANVTQSS